MFGPLNLVDEVIEFLRRLQQIPDEDDSVSQLQRALRTALCARAVTAPYPPNAQVRDHGDDNPTGSGGDVVDSHAPVVISAAHRGEFLDDASPMFHVHLRESARCGAGHVCEVPASRVLSRECHGRAHRASTSVCHVLTSFMSVSA